MTTKRTLSRRGWLGSSTATAVAMPLLISSDRVFGANDKLNVAAVGVGGKGKTDLAGASGGNNVVAICDVDERTLQKAADTYPGARTYHDWRKMLEQKDIDAVTVSTPDHMHAPIAVSAMQLGKHVYVQKPLAHTVYEARQMRLIAREQSVVTQMGNQHHNGSGYLTLVRHVRDGRIGKVQEAHAWSNRPIWPQNVARPERQDTPPAWLHWDLWLGVAQKRPYVGPGSGAKKGRGLYHPFNWRGWLDFGVGALGDMGCHIIDPVVWSCELAAPTHVRSIGPAPNAETFPAWETIHYDFAGTRHTAGKTFRMTWYDGGKLPASDTVTLPDGVSWPSNGVLLIGEQGAILCSHGREPIVFTEGKLVDGLERVPPGNHYQQWTAACRGVGETTSGFDYAGPLTETVLLGTIAVRFPNETLAWDSKTLSISSHPRANQFVHHPYRTGWEVRGLTR